MGFVTSVTGIGYPLGCSGARIVTTLLTTYEMRHRGTGRRAATMYVGGGQGIASLRGGA